MNDLILIEFEGFLYSYNYFLSSFGLTKRESEISFLINKGCSNREIGELLYISEVTVKKHVYNIFNKCGVNRRFEFFCKLRDSKDHLTEKAC